MYVCVIEVFLLLFFDTMALFNQPMGTVVPYQVF